MAPSFIPSFVLNVLALLCLLSAAYFAIGFHRKPVLAWTIPLHLSYQDYSVGHSRNLARYDSELWNRIVDGCGALAVGLTLVAFLRQRHYQSRSSYLRQMPESLDLGGKFVSRIARGAEAHTNFRFGTKTLVALVFAAYIGSEVSSGLFGMHASIWETRSPIRQVATAAITDELTRVPAATPWDIGSVMLRSAFEHTVAQKGPGALEITHEYLSRHLREPRVQGTTVYPSIRTHGVGAAPVPWMRWGYKVSPEHRVLSYAPVVAGTNVTVSCSDTTEEWTWDHNMMEVSVETGRPLIVHHFDVQPKTDWNTRGPHHEVSYVEGKKGINLETWLTMWRSNDGLDIQARQIFIFTNVSPLDREPTVSVIDCVYGGVDVVRQVYMKSPIEPIVFGDVLGVKDTLSWDDLWPAAVAIEEALNRDGGMMVAGMAAGAATSLEMWDYFLDRNLELHELIEHVLVDTAQAYFSLVRQWKEEKGCVISRVGL